MSVQVNSLKSLLQIKGEVQFVDLIGAKNGSGATFKATDLYWPIPVNEIQRNPNLTQNEGYSAK